MSLPKRSVLFLCLSWMLPHAAMAESESGRYYSRGGKAEYSVPYYSSQRYQTNSEYHNVYEPGVWRFGNRWVIAREYQVDLNGNVIGAGRLYRAGEAERVYRLNDPSEERRVVEKEARIAQEHREYLKTTERSQQYVADHHSENLRLQGRTDRESVSRRKANDNMNQTHSILQRLEAKYHSETMRGD